MFVGEPLVRGEDGHVAVEDGQELLRALQLVHRDRHQVVGDLVPGGLVEVVADARPVGEQMLDGDTVADEPQVGSQHRTRRRCQIEHSVLDQPYDGQRRQTLGGTGRREPGRDRVGDAVGAVGEPERLLEPHVAGVIDPHDAGKPGAARDVVNPVRESSRRGVSLAR